MGTDIHLFVEKRKAEGWEAAKGKWPYADMYRRNMEESRLAGNEESARYWERGLEEAKGGVIKNWIYDGRSYDVFAILANVRNGTGFAGCDTGNGFNPIAMPRGIPEDASKEVQTASDDYGGGHSAGWLSLKELQAHDWEQTTQKRGFVTKEEAAKFRQTSELPSMWCGGVSEAAAYRYEQIEWEISYREAASHFLDSVMPELERLAEGDPESVRLVFWFDS